MRWGLLVLKSTRPHYSAWIHPDLERRQSPIDGFGLFACRDLPAGEVVQRIGGRPMSEREFLAEAAKHSRYNALQIDEDLHLFDTESFDGGFNHCCDSNCWLQDEVTVETRCAIREGEELTIDYAQFTTMDGPLLSVPCGCGAAACRGIPTGGDWRLPQLHSRYPDHFSPFLNNRIRNGDV